MNITEKPKLGDKLIYWENNPFKKKKTFTVVAPENKTKVPYSARIIGMQYEDGSTDIINWISGDGVINPFIHSRDSQ